MIFSSSDLDGEKERWTEFSQRRGASEDNLLEWEKLKKSRWKPSTTYQSKHVDTICPISGKCIWHELFHVCKLETLYVDVLTDLKRVQHCRKEFLHLAVMICGFDFTIPRREERNDLSWYRLKVTTTKDRYPRQRATSRRDDWGLPFRRLKHAASIRWIVFHDPTNGRATVHALWNCPRSKAVS